MNEPVGLPGQVFAEKFAAYITSRFEDATHERFLALTIFHHPMESIRLIEEIKFDASYFTYSVLPNRSMGPGAVKGWLQMQRSNARSIGLRVVSLPRFTPVSMSQTHHTAASESTIWTSNPKPRAEPQVKDIIVNVRDSQKDSRSCAASESPSNSNSEKFGTEKMGTQTAIPDEERTQVVLFLSGLLSAHELRQALLSTRMSTKSKSAKGSRTRRHKTIEAIIAEAESMGSPVLQNIPDSQLSDVLLDLTGTDLFCFGKDRGQYLRHLVVSKLPHETYLQLLQYRGAKHTTSIGGRDSTIIAERRWSPGKAWPRHFVQTCQLPLSFAGKAGNPAEPATLEVEPGRALPPLADFQAELVAKAIQVLGELPGHNRGVLSLPTGAGKTRTAVEALLKWRLAQDSRPAILWIAQSEELCEQAVQAFREVWVDFGYRVQLYPHLSESLTIGRVWGSRPAPEEPDVIVATIQALYSTLTKDNEAKESLHNGSQRRIQLREILGTIGCVLVDEAHRLETPSYRKVMEALGLPIYIGRTTTLPILGLTATPGRRAMNETLKLVARFHSELLTPPSLGDDPIGRLRSRRVLARAVREELYSGNRVIDVETNTTYREYYEKFQDFHPYILSRLGEDANRNRRLRNRILELNPDWPVLVFASSVDHAYALATLLRRQGRKAIAISGETRPSTRRAAIEDFRAGRYSVLCNYGILTTGFDAPSVRAVVVARPTSSPILYEQMLGRGLRGPKFGGTEECLIIDVIDNIRFGGEMAYMRFKEFWA